MFRDHYAQGILFDIIFMDINMPLMGVNKLILKYYILKNLGYRMHQEFTRFDG
jgi:hypothetical protein